MSDTVSLDKNLTEAIIRFQNGDDTAFQAVYDNSVRYVNYSILMSLQDKGLAKDILQETYLEVYKNLKSLKDSEAFKKWAVVIAHNKISRYYRNNKDSVFSSEEEMDNVIGNEEEENADMLPEDALDNQETQRLILDIINGLPEIQRETVISFYYNQMSITEISDALGVPENTTKTNLSRGRKKIKDGVLELEKKHGIKLYTLPLIAVLSGLFAKEAMAAELPADGLALIGSGSQASAVAGAAQSVAVKGAAVTTAKTASIKWLLIGVAGLAIVGTGTAAVIGMNNKNKAETAAIEATMENTAADNTVTSEAATEAVASAETDETEKEAMEEATNETEDASEEASETEETEEEIDYNEEYYREMMKDITSEPIAAICVDDFDDDGVNGAFVATVPEDTDLEFAEDFLTTSLYYLEKNDYTEIYKDDPNYSKWFDQIKMDTGENILTVATLSSGGWAPDRNYDHTLYIVRDHKPICLGQTAGMVSYNNGELAGCDAVSNFDPETETGGMVYQITPYTIENDKLVAGTYREEFEEY